MKTIIQTAILTAVLSLITVDAFASSIYDLSNCTAADTQAAKTQLEKVRKGVNDGYISKLELASADVFMAEVSLCAGEINKTDACASMIKNQDIVAGYASGFEETRRLVQIRNFCR